MLLRHTPKEITERKALTINPAKTCQSGCPGPR